MKKLILAIASLLITTSAYGIRCAEALNDYKSIEPPSDGVFREYELTPQTKLLFSKFESKLLGQRMAYGVRHEGQLLYLSKRFRKPMLIDDEMVLISPSIRNRNDGGYTRFVLRILTEWNNEGSANSFGYILETQTRKSRFSDWSKAKTIAYNEGGRMKYLHTYPTEIRKLNTSLFMAPTVSTTLFDQPFYERNLR